MKLLAASHCGAILGVLCIVFGLTAAGNAQTPPSQGTSVSQEERTSTAVDEALEALLTVLRDEAAREALIERLRDQSEQGAEDATSERPANFAQRLAEATATAASETVSQVSRIGAEFTRLRFAITRIAEADTGQYHEELVALLFTIISTLAVFGTISLATARLAKRLTPCIGARLRLRARGALIVFAARLGAVFVAWLTGYLLATLVLGTDTNEPTEAQSLYLNAFAVFGLVRTILRTAVAPDADHEPTLTTLAPGAQAIIYRHLKALSGIVIQGFLFIVPLSQAWGGFAVARPLRTLIATIAAIIALIAIRRVTRALDATHERTAGSVSVAEGAQSAWRKIWPKLAITYVAYCWFIGITRPNLLEEIVIAGTLYSLAALALLLLALWVLRTAPTWRAPIPHAVSAALPQLGPRMDRIMTFVGWTTAFLLSIAALALIIGGWGWVNIGALISDPAVQLVLWRLASAVLVVFTAALLWAAVASWIDHRLARDLPGRNVSARSRTLLALFRNAFTIAIGILATMVTLSQLGIDIAPLLAGAGVIGLAIGFGAQKLVQDIITGIFIQLENAMNEGDVVGVAGITGVVEKITIRSARLRTLDGAAHVVPFSSVDTVTNLTRDFAYHVAEIGAAYKEKVSDVKAAMEEAFTRLAEDGFADDILEPLEMQGVTMLGDSAVVVRARIKTLPGKQWSVGRRYTELVKEVMEERGLEIPFPHRQIVLPERFALPYPEAKTDPNAAGG